MAAAQPAAHLPPLSDIGQRVRPVAGAAEQLLPVAPVLVPAISRLRRGITVSVRGSTSIALLLAAGPSSAGLWVALVGLPAVGVMAAAEAGIDLERLALIDVAARDVRGGCGGGHRRGRRRAGRRWDPHGRCPTVGRPRPNAAPCWWRSTGRNGPISASARSVDVVGTGRRSWPSHQPAGCRHRWRPRGWRTRPDSRPDVVTMTWSR